MTGEVSPAGPGGQPISPGQLRASHEDRDSVVEQLRVAAGDGRLTADELDERLELALTARTYAELARLTADLPAAGGAGLAAAGPRPAPKDLVRIQCGSGNAVREGTWLVPRNMETNITSGNVRLDFTQAVISGATLRIDADIRSGNLVLITKPGVVVDTDDVAIRSGNVRVRTPWGSGAPEILRIEITGRVRSGNIVARPRYRTLWQWLRRAPRPWETPATGLARR
jgi:Domain of unknown function (DUF1707)